MNQESPTLAEGQGRKNRADFRRFLLIAMGSLNETLTILAVSENLKIIPDEELQKLRPKILINLCYYNF